MSLIMKVLVTGGAGAGGLIIRIVFEHSGIVLCLILEDAVSPSRKAFRLERRLPCSLLGPVLFLAFCRFGSAKVRTVLSILPAVFSRPIRLSH
jgi:hypothetical protein